MSSTAPYAQVVYIPSELATSPVTTAAGCIVVGVAGRCINVLEK
jgi:hypothetical protein